MRDVVGFLTEDGTFYEHAEDAEKHEALQSLSGAYTQYVGKGANFVRFQNVIINLAPEIRRFLNAVEGPEFTASVIAETEQASIEREILATRQTETRQHPSDDGLGGSFEGVVEQSGGRPVHVSDMGDSPQSEEVPVKRTLDGVRSRRTDA